MNIFVMLFIIECLVHTAILVRIGHIGILYWERKYVHKEERERKFLHSSSSVLNFFLNTSLVYSIAFQWHDRDLMAFDGISLDFFFVLDKFGMSCKVLLYFNTHNFHFSFLIKLKHF